MSGVRLAQQLWRRVFGSDLPSEDEVQIVLQDLSLRDKKA